MINLIRYIRASVRPKNWFQRETVLIPQPMDLPQSITTDELFQPITGDRLFTLNSHIKTKYDKDIINNYKVAFTWKIPDLPIE